MATKRQKYHSMIVSSEKIVKRVRRDCDRYGTRCHKLKFWVIPKSKKYKRWK